MVAALCEPDLLRKLEQANLVFDLLDKITRTVSEVEDRKTEGFKVLRKALGYGWSVVVAAQPEMGKSRMEKWAQVEDKTIHWIMRENLKKRRLAHMDDAWVDEIYWKLM